MNTSPFFSAVRGDRAAGEHGADLHLVTPLNGRICSFLQITERERERERERGPLSWVQRLKVVLLTDFSLCCSSHPLSTVLWFCSKNFGEVKTGHGGAKCHDSREPWSRGPFPSIPLCMSFNFDQLVDSGFIYNMVWVVKRAQSKRDLMDTDQCWS